MAHLDACTFLDEEHKQLLRLFEQYASASDGSGRQLLAQKIGRELSVHMQLEEEVFYPAFARATGNDQLVEESRREHARARELIGSIDKARLDHTLVLELEDVTLHHINDERDRMFPAARAAQALDLRGLARELEERRSELTAGHPA